MRLATSISHAFECCDASRARAKLTAARGSESATDSRGDTPEADELDGVLAQSASELQDLIVATRFCRTLATAADRRCFLRDLCAFLPQAEHRGQPEAGTAAGLRGAQVAGEGGAEVSTGDVVKEVSTGDLVKELQGLTSPGTGRQVRRSPR